ncbi:hypothetical protein Peur_009770 [Populus x canadensis]
MDSGKRTPQRHNCSAVVFFPAITSVNSCQLFAEQEIEGGLLRRDKGQVRKQSNWAAK